MAIIIHKVQNDNTSQEKSFGKWYPRVVNLKTIDLDGLCEHIATHGACLCVNRENVTNDK